MSTLRWNYPFAFGIVIYCRLFCDFFQQKVKKIVEGRLAIEHSPGGAGLLKPRRLRMLSRQKRLLRP